jgi:DNA repair exonuclease SbcCD nuclease subunit
VTRILHFSDLHLDRSFAGLGMASSEASKRRGELRSALRRIVDLAIERDVDALTIGGDLYEHDRVTQDTANFMRQEFARLAPRRVLVAPGNHDPYVPDAAYSRMEWPENVHVFESMTWEAVQVSGCRVWGVGHRGVAIRDNLMADLRLDGAGMNIALMHGSDISAVPAGKDAHCPFERADIERSGADFVLLGHYHEMRLKPADSPLYAYPGSPEPLNFGEEGQHYVLLLEADGGNVSVEPIPINEVSYRTAEIDVTGLATSDAVRELIERSSGEGFPSPEIVRVLLTGQTEPEVDLDREGLLHGCAQFFRYLDIVDRTDAPFELEQIRGESTTRGMFVRLMEQRIEDAPADEREVLQQALQYGLQGFAGMGIRRR